MEIGGWSLLEVAIAGFFGAWFVLSVAGQIWPRDAAIRRSPVRALIPDWRFFAPEPAVEDRVVIFRRKSTGGEIGPVQTVTFPRGGGFRSLWNPGHRRHKAVFDVTERVHRLAVKLNDGEDRDDLPDALMLTEPYLVLLNLVTARVDESDAGLVQFGIVHRGWPDREELVFLSRWHGLET